MKPATVNRAGAMVDTTYAYYGAGENFRLQSIQSGPQSVMPAFFYTAYDNAGNLTGQTIWGEAYTYAYDERNRLTSVRGGLSQDYRYDRLGNFDTATKWGETWDYSYWNGTSRVKGVSGLDFGPPANETGAVYDARGNLTKYKQGDVTTSLSYDVEGRLTSVTSAGQTTQFFYDADGNRVLTVLPGDNPTQLYTPFPDYQKEVPGGANPTVTQRVTFSANGRAMAQWVKVGATATLYALYTDHLGSVVAVGTAGGSLVANSYATYQPFGAFVSNPTGTNPSVTDRGFTGHKHNNTGTNNLGLIYMNARYYHPQLGRFVSPDTIVPEPGEPQSYNRYSYVRNSPMNFTDPTGYRECGASINCRDFADQYQEIPSGPAIKFEEEGGATWTPEERSAVRALYMSSGQRQADVINALFPYWDITPGQALLLVYHGPVTFRKVNMSCADDARNTLETCGARTESRNLVTVYTDANIVGNKEHWAGHELGHAFVYAVGSSAPVDALRSAQRNRSFPNRTGYSLQVDFGFGSTHEHPWLWQQSSDPAPEEELADMFLGWSYGTWALSPEGQARQEFMDANMPKWISTALQNW